MNLKPKFDYYSASVFSVDPEQIIAMLTDEFPQCSVKQGRPAQSYIRGYHIHRSDEEYCVVSYGGVNDGVHVESKSKSHLIAPLIRRYDHQVSRIDAAIDVVEPFFFEWATDELTKIALKRNVKIDQAGDWTRSKSRTLYLGTRSSIVQICMYEKGHKEGANPDWVRVETRIRPHKKHHKIIASTYTENQVISYPTYMHHFYKMMGHNYEQQVIKPMIYTRSDFERSIYNMAKQYGKLCHALLDRVDGDWERVGDTLSTAYDSIQKSELPSQTIQTIKEKIAD